MLGTVRSWRTLALDVTAFALASCSIVSLLLYFFGISTLRTLAGTLVVPSCVALGALGPFAARCGHATLRRQLAAAVWAGALATLAYDVVRMPLAHGGVPVFKAISYFGTLILDVPRPSVGSELAGWGYHLSNGIGFAVMYAMLVRRPALWSAVLWGVFLEGMMLVTPYAEVFGYGRSATFVAISLGAHVFYGIGLWAGLRLAGAAPPHRSWQGWRLLAWFLGVGGVLLIGLDFHRLHAATIPSPPPRYVGPHLYVTWSVPEPDRVGALWLLRRFEDPRARIHFVEPMSKIPLGVPFDLPEAEIRRNQSRSTFEVMLDRNGLTADPAMAELARLCHVTEIQPWALASAERERALLEEFKAALRGCTDLRLCLDAGMDWFEGKYREAGGEGG